MPAAVPVQHVEDGLQVGLVVGDILETGGMEADAAVAHQPAALPPPPGQVDQVATSMVETEKTMNDLQFATGLAPVDEEVPELLASPPVQIVR